MTTAPARGRDDGPSIATFDLAALIGALDPGYLAGGHEARLTGLVHCDAARELYVVVGEGHVFVSRDAMGTLVEVAELNRCDGALGPARLAVGRLHRRDDGRDDPRHRPRPLRRRHRAGWMPPSATPLAPSCGASRAASGPSRATWSTETAWATGKSGNATAGFFGPRRDAAVAFVPYTDGGAHLFTSLDDGATWRAHDLSRYFVHHAHEAYLPRSVGNARTARMWVTGGDDPSGARSGVVCFAGLRRRRRAAAAHVGGARAPWLPPGRPRRQRQARVRGQRVARGRRAQALRQRGVDRGRRRRGRLRQGAARLPPVPLAARHLRRAGGLRHGQLPAVRGRQRARRRRRLPLRQHQRGRLGGRDSARGHVDDRRGLRRPATCGAA